MTYVHLRAHLLDQLRHASPAVRARAVEEVGLHRDHAFLFAVLENVQSRDAAVGRATAFALSRFRVPAARTGLLHLLHHPSESVVLAAIDGLRAIGSREELEHLRALIGGFLGDRAIKQAARAAIEAIEGRSDATRGSLSIAEEERGDLSLADAAGALSPTDESL